MHIILLTFCFLLSITVVLFSIYTGISPMPSSRRAKQKMVAMTPQNSKIIYELGSGWGGLAFKLAKAFPEAQIEAFEISPLPWFISLILGKRFSNLKIHRKNFYYRDLFQADVIVCYLYPGAMTRLKSKFESELLPGTRIISNTFSIPGWTLQQREEIPGFWKSEILFYVKSSAG